MHGRRVCRSAVDGVLPYSYLSVSRYGPLYEMSSSLTWDSTGEYL